MADLPREPINGRCGSSVEVSLLRSISYANAKSWDDLVHAFAEPLKNSSLDEIILLLHTTSPGPDAPCPKHVRSVFYNRLEEVPELLLSKTPSTLRTDAIPTNRRWPRAGAATGVQPNSDHDGRRQQKHIFVFTRLIP